MHFYTFENNQQCGPYTELQLRNKVANGEMAADTLIWREGIGSGIKYSEYFSRTMVRDLPPVPGSERSNPGYARSQSSGFGANTSHPKQQHSTCKLPHVSKITRSSNRISLTSVYAEYPKWPWIAFLVCGIFSIVFFTWVSAIETEAIPYVKELNRMSSGGYAAAAVFEAFVRGYSGDPFGKLNEETDKANYISDRLEQIAAPYKFATIGRNLFVFLALLSAVLWIWQHMLFIKRRESSQE